MLDRLICWWRTGHDWEALGSCLWKHAGPHYVYQCKNCRKIKHVPWPE